MPEPGIRQGAQLTTSINLRNSSICTDTPTGSDLFPYSDSPTQFIQNTGIERNGGITNIYQQQTTFTTTGISSVIAKDGTVIQVDSSNNVYLDDVIIGNIGSQAVYSRGTLFQYADAAWTADNTILGLKLSGFTITLDEYDPFSSPATVKNTRNITFASFGSYRPVVGVYFVRYVDMHYADNQEFITFSGFKSGGSYILKESGTAVTNIPTYCCNFAWRFASGTDKYLWGVQGMPISASFTSGTPSNTFWYIGTITGGTASLPYCQYVTIDRFSGTSYSRAMFTFPFSFVSATATAGGGFVGYVSSLGTFSTTPIYGNLATSGLATGTTIASLVYTTGPGYSEAIVTYSSATTSVYHWVFPSTFYKQAVPYTYVNIACDVLQNSYGKLTDVNGNEVSYAAWRSVIISGVPALISIAALSFATAGTQDDILGVPITNVGEFDETYVPHVDDNATSGYSRIIYRYNKNLFYVDVRTRASLASSSFMKVSDNFYLANTLSPINTVDLISRNLVIGVNDYNGRMAVSGTAGSASGKINSLIQNANSNSIDVGDRVSTVLTTANIFGGSIQPVGVNLPSFLDRIPSDWGTNIYFNDVYSITYLGSGWTGLKYNINNSFSGVGYVPDTRIPFGMGYTFYERIMQTEIETIFLGVGVTGSADIVYDYAGYETGNDITNKYQSFVLFGQTYLFDGSNIWIASFSGSLFSGKGNSPVCIATGMRFIAVSPTEAYFLSSFDNSLYVFNGGRSLTKVKRLNQEDTISNGVYNVRDGTLLLNGTNSFIWIRDGIATKNAKLATQTSISLFDTQQGITIANNTTKWVYSFASLASSTVVPLTWQSAYHSFKGNELSEAINWVVTLHSPGGKIAAPVTLTCHSFDQDGYNKQVASMTINPNKWDDLYFTRARIQPKHRKALASSVQVDTTSHLVITDVAIEYGDVGQARIEPARSK